MRFHRLQNPKTIDEEAIAKLIASGAQEVVVQFVEEANYDVRLLHTLNGACRRFGSKLTVRFYGHYSNAGQFDAAWLRHLPQVCSLNLDCLMHVKNVSHIAELHELKAFAFGVFESDVPELLSYPSLRHVHRLVLAHTRKNNIDLAPLETYQRLEVLFLNGHARNIATLGDIATIRRLSLSQIAKRVSVAFVGDMVGLRSLTLLLGGRPNTAELAHPNLIHLEVLRVRGLADIDLSGFPLLQAARIEDQLQLRALRLQQGSVIHWLSIWNCKNLATLQGLRQAAELRSLSVGQTSLDPDTILDNAPPSLEHLVIGGLGRGTKDERDTWIRARGYTPEMPYRDPEDAAG